MPYLCKLTPRPDDVHVSIERDPFEETRIWTRGFSCTEAELITELETATRAKRGTLTYHWIHADAVSGWIETARRNGGHIYLNREGFE